MDQLRACLRIWPNALPRSSRTANATGAAGPGPVHRSRGPVCSMTTNGLEYPRPASKLLTDPCAAWPVRHKPIAAGDPTNSMQFIPGNQVAACCAEGPCRRMARQRAAAGTPPQRPVRPRPAVCTKPAVITSAAGRGKLLKIILLKKADTEHHRNFAGSFSTTAPSREVLSTNPFDQAAFFITEITLSLSTAVFLRPAIKTQDQRQDQRQINGAKADAAAAGVRFVPSQPGTCPPSALTQCRLPLMPTTCRSGRRNDLGLSQTISLCRQGGQTVATAAGRRVLRQRTMASQGDFSWQTALRGLSTQTPAAFHLRDPLLRVIRSGSGGSSINPKNYSRRASHP